MPKSVSVSLDRVMPLLVWVLAFPVVSMAQAPSPDKLAQVFHAYQHSDSPGCAVAVDAPNLAGESSGNEWTAAYGMADLEHGVANTPATVFEAGSVSKQFTAAAVLLLVERGKVGLDDDIRKYFPELPAYEKPITVRQLLNHTSGLRDWGSVEEIAGWPRTTREYTHANVLDILSRQHALNYKPGEAWSYTNSGYNLAAMLVERVSGMTLQAFCRKEFFEPLGMTSTQWRDDFRRIVPNRAIAYEARGKEWRQDMPFEDIYGNGGLLTTAGDLLKWNANITSGKLHPAIFAQMQKPSALNDGQPVEYGFGLFLEQFEGMAQVAHSGATAGYRAWLGRIPSKGLSIAILCNATTANTTAFAAQITRLYLGLGEPTPPAQPEHAKPGLYVNQREHTMVKVAEKDDAIEFDGHPVRMKVRFDGEKMFTPQAIYGEDIWDRVEPWTPKDLAGFSGLYSSDEAETVLRVAVENGKLVVHRRPDASFLLTPTYKDAFACELGSVRFVRDGAGKIVALSLGDSRVWDLRFTRQTDPKR